jgi:hypothetical protein
MDKGAIDLDSTLGRFTLFDLEYELPIEQWEKIFLLLDEIVVLAKLQDYVVKLDMDKYSFYSIYKIHFKENNDHCTFDFVFENDNNNFDNFTIYNSHQFLDGKLRSFLSDFSDKSSFSKMYSSYLSESIEDTVSLLSGFRELIAYS